MAVVRNDARGVGLWRDGWGRLKLCIIQLNACFEDGFSWICGAFLLFYNKNTLLKGVMVGGKALSLLC